MTKTSRRSVVRGIAWTAPVLAACAPVPAYATSAPVCNPTAECKQPGEGSNTKDYAIRTNCVSGGDITSVRVYDDKAQAWIVATLELDGTWLARGFNDSRRARLVEITTQGGTVTSSIPFPPC